MMASSRSSVASFRLPSIQHPLSRLGHVDSLSLRGYSTDYGDHKPTMPLSPDMGRRSGANRREQIAEVHQPQLPPFGQKVAGESLAPNRVSTMEPSTCDSVLNDQVDQLEYSLKEQIKRTGALTLKTMFKNNNPEGKPLANRSVLLVILTRFLRRLVTARQLKLLLHRLQLSDRCQINFEELHSALRDSDRSGPLSHHHVINFLRGTSRTGFLECLKSLGDKESTSQSWISASQLRNILENLKLHLHHHEFGKLWKRLDADGVGAVKVNVLLENLGLQKKTKDLPEDKDEKCTSSVKDNGFKSPVKLEEDLQESVTMETWLKDRLRTGAQRMKAEFDKRDPDGRGQVSAEDFLQVLAAFDLRLTRHQLKVFLSRCGLELHKGTVDYIHFLRTFQDRSQGGVMNRILSNPKHRFHSEEKSSHASSVSGVEAKLTRLFQTEYLSIMQGLRNIDKASTGTVGKQEFRAVMESRLGLEISDAEFEQLLDRLPLDRAGDVQYRVFMTAFDSRKGAPSLFEVGKTARNSGSSQVSTNKEDERGMVDKDQHICKLSSMIRSLVSQQYRDVVRAFEELDEKNTRRLTQEDMYQLLKRFPAPGQAEVTRGDVRRLWSSLLTRLDGTLEFDQLLRQFGPSAGSRRYPDAKRCPPKRGDSDLMRLSNTLSYVSDMLRHSVRTKVELSAGELWDLFSGLDLSGSGCVSREEFRDVLMNLCDELTLYECELLANKFDLNHDGRVSFREFLRPFTSRDQVWRLGSNMAAALQSHRDAGHDDSSLETLNSRIRKKLHRRRRALRQACQRLDPSGTGHLFASELAAVLQLCGACDGQDDLQRVFSLLDVHSSGRLDYRPLLRKHPTTLEDEQNRPESPMSQNVLTTHRCCNES